MKNPRLVFAVAAAVALLAVGTGAAALAGGCGSPAARDQVAGRVNGRPLYRSQVAEARAQARLSQQQLTYKQALDRLIDDELVRQAAVHLGVTVPATEVDRRLAQVESGAGGAAALDAALKSAGLTRAQLRDAVVAMLRRERLAGVKFPGKSASTADARSFYRKNLSLFRQPAAVNLGDIALKTEGYARSVIKRLGMGYDFSAVSRQYTRQDGLMGWVSLPSLPAEMARAVAGLKRGEVSGPVQAFGGWHVLKVLGRRSAHTVPFAQARAPIQAELTRRRQLAALADWLKEARSAARVEVTP